MASCVMDAGAAAADDDDAKDWKELQTGSHSRVRLCVQKILAPPKENSWERRNIRTFFCLLYAEPGKACTEQLGL